jgi:NAD-dependent SIR2 family protein deacetylase
MNSPSKISLLFLLGSGCSVDAGISTYQQVSSDDLENALDANSLKCQRRLTKMWEFLCPLVHQIRSSVPSQFYTLLDTLRKRSDIKCTIVTQNVDGLISNVIELHGNLRLMTCLKCHQQQKCCPLSPECQVCFSSCRPNIVLYGESLDQQVSANVNKVCKQHHKFMLVVGTSLKFEYLHEMIRKSKQRGSKIIHINPDPEYGKHVKNNEIWMQTNAYEGLKQFIEQTLTQVKH